MLENLNTSFKKFGGEKIPSVIDYLKEKLAEDPNLTVSIGCDSKDLRSKTMYAITIMLYNQSINNGAHVIFNRHVVKHVADSFNRLYLEAEYMNDLGNFLQDELSKFYKRNDIDEYNMKKYKYHLLQHTGKYLNLTPIDEYNTIKSMYLSEEEKMIEYKLVDVHLDYNIINEAKNRSYILTKSTVPWLRGQGFRTWTKFFAPSATSAADLLLKRS